MRHMALALFVVVLGQRLGAQSPSKLDVPIKGGFFITDLGRLSPCAVGAVIVQVARQGSVLAGFESTPDCWLSPRFDPFDPEVNGQALPGMSAREAFDQLMTLMPMYSWKDMDGVVVVRPKGSWDDPADVLNFPAKRFNAMNQRIDDVLHTLLARVVPVAFYPHEDVPKAGRPIDRLVSVEFPGGSMLDALNAVVRAGGELEWQLGYTGGLATIAVTTFDWRGGSVMAPVALPETRR
jgi:hypothetical protein